MTDLRDHLYKEIISRICATLSAIGCTLALLRSFQEFAAIQIYFHPYFRLKISEFTFF